MNFTLYFLLIIFYVTTTNSSFYTNKKSDIFDFSKKPKEYEKNSDLRESFYKEPKYVQTLHLFDNNINYGDVKYKTTARHKNWKRDRFISGDGGVADDYVKNRYNIPSREIQKLQSLVKDISEGYLTKEPNLMHQKHTNENEKDMEKARHKAKILKKAKMRDLNMPSHTKKGIFQMDPVLNIVRRQNYRRKLDPSSISSEFTSAENKKWKEEYREKWMMKKFQAINATPPEGDTINMVGARPWGVPCGDPAQHDLPWGSCATSMECEPEYRIYRGDFFCGRTEFVCCAIQLSNYDLYQGFDVSFDEQSLSTDSAEKKGLKSKEKRHKKRKRERKKRKKARMNRKRAIKRNIRKIVREIGKLLNKQYRNGTSQRKKKTRLLKKFIKKLKKQFKADRHSVKELHEEEMLKIDAALQARLNKIQSVNDKFMRNDTFRDIIINGTIWEKGAKMLLRAYPGLANALRKGRRMTGLDSNSDKEKESHDYDVEYGYLYY